MSFVSVRFPPSPTGYLHVGNVRTLLYNYLFAKQCGGRIVFRSEDTDRARSTREFEEANIAELLWLGLSWDEFYRQSERTEVYREKIDALLARNIAYVSREESKMNPGVTVEVIRLRNPNVVVTFTDVIRGDITFDTTELGDIVIARSLDNPIYHFTVVVDDALMGITHVIRGEDHISNTSRQILIQEALGFDRPVYAHVPMLLGVDRTKLSKRHGAVSLRAFREEGFLPEALVNYLALLGWTPKSTNELLTMEELVNLFNLTQVHKSGAIFSREKLEWFNRQYVQKKTLPEKLSYLAPFLEKEYASLLAVLEKSPSALNDVCERIHTASELVHALKKGEYSYYMTRPMYSPSLLVWKKDQDVRRTYTRLAETSVILEQIGTEAWSAHSVGDALKDYVEREGKGNVLWPFRVALSGAEISPDPFTIAEAIGREETLSRLGDAKKRLKAYQPSVV